MYAGVAQLVEQLTCNQQVGGSNPFASSAAMLRPDLSGLGTRLMGGRRSWRAGADCKSVGLGL